MKSLDAREARRRFNRAAVTCAEVSTLAREVERRMSERLEYVKLMPKRILDAGCGLGDGLRLLRRRYARAALLGVDVALAMVREARSRRPFMDRARSAALGWKVDHICADMASLPIAPSCVGLVWSNLALAWAGDPLAVFREFHRVLEVGGLLMFSTYGPDTLKELKRAFAHADGATHVHRFIDMHDLGDMLVATGFAEPVMDMECITVTFPDVAAIARDLRHSGQSNVAADRRRGLTGRHAWEAMLRGYECVRSDGNLPATFEIVCGHAWKMRPRTIKNGRTIVRIDAVLNKSR